METITADAVFLVCFVGNPVQEGMFGHRLMESGVKNTDLRNVRQYIRTGIDAGNIGRIV